MSDWCVRAPPLTCKGGGRAPDEETYGNSHPDVVSRGKQTARKLFPTTHRERANFTGLVLGCIEAYFCNQILVGMMNLHSKGNGQKGDWNALDSV